MYSLHCRTGSADDAPTQMISLSQVEVLSLISGDFVLDSWLLWASVRLLPRLPYYRNNFALYIEANIDLDSTARSPRTLRNHSHLSHDHVYCWRLTDIWYNHQFRDVLPGRTRILAMTEVLLRGEAIRAHD
jgi:hypothetical protein